MQQSSKLKQVIQLFKELECILKQEITRNIRYVMDGITYCLKILQTTSGQDIPPEVKDVHRRFYPPHGGLTDYFLWDDDFDKRVALNEELKDVQEQLKAILKD